MRSVRWHVGVLAWVRRQREWRRDHIAAFAAAINAQPDGLTAFQHNALASVARFVPPHEFKRVPTKSKEPDYLVAPFGSRGSELYIYANEAHIFGTKPHRWFEEWDFRTPEELLQALVEECETRAT
jgi:hypothetical protein